MDQESNQGLYVQYGCGWSAPENWRNFDASPTLKFERLPVIGKMYTKNKDRFPANVEFGNIIKGLPIAAESCSGVYCSHVLEHLALTEFKSALKNTYNMLQPGGIFRFVLPDLEYAAKTYLENESPMANSQFMKETHLGLEKRPRSLKALIVSWLGNSNHFWMWDYKGMKAALEEAGFTEIRRAEFGDASDQAFEKVEEIHRWENCLGVECIRPR